MYRYLFNRVKRLIPKISETELIALRSGTTSIDREIYQGSVNINNFPKLNTDSHQLEGLRSGVNNLLSTYGDKNVYPNSKINDILRDISETRLFGLIIPEKYGGYKISTVELSRLLVYITSHNPSLGVTVMVPNSLGPGELLERYGTDFQKQKYLPGLAWGDYIPCFGLTGPNNGSDATGMIDTGVVKKIDGKNVVEVTLDKRYITLAPVANLVGIAFRLTDPEKLLPSGSEGVTVALLEGNHPGLARETYHNPLNVGFPNGTLKGTVRFSVDDIIGGVDMAGAGWKMLMECLASGRAVSLPATALAASKTATYGVYQYSLHRKQFKLPLINMEAVANKIAEMVFHTWTIESSVSLTNHLLDAGERPAVISALMKQQTTDRAREVINHGMDIHAGSSICHGYGNFMEKFYRSAPVGITVEGSNTLTKNLIIFGQGLNKSHPYIFPILESILDDDLEGFRKNFNKQVAYLTRLYLTSLLRIGNNRLHKQTRDFALLANFVSLQGGKIKSNQSLSGDMADIFSNLYLAYSLEWYHRQKPVSKILTDYCRDRLLDENNIIINRVISNNKYYHLWHLKTRLISTNYGAKKRLIRELKQNPNILNAIKTDVYRTGTILEDFEKLENLDSNESSYEGLVQKIIAVGEYPIEVVKVVKDENK